ncbi:hypothetical protein B0H11DRAFT_2284044 [Mycena galericulata]|nr:hypothetical protein B0H11DRAFT_2284044 [Mycena galericulata]
MPFSTSVDTVMAFVFTSLDAARLLAIHAPAAHTAPDDLVENAKHEAYTAAIRKDQHYLVGPEAPPPRAAHALHVWAASARSIMSAQQPTRSDAHEKVDAVEREEEDPWH